jgi:tetratricopeptide (TPR) repeat protein
VAYESLLYSRRRRLHRRVGSYIELEQAGNLEPVYETLAYHYARGGEKPRALLFSVRAGDKARLAYANDEALDHYGRAVSLAKEVDSLTEDEAAESYVNIPAVHTGMADVLELTGAHAGAVRHYGEALRELTGAPAAGRGPLRMRRGADSRFVQRGLRQPAARRRAIANVCRRLGIVHERLSAYGVAQDWFRTGIAVLPRGAAVERARGCIGVSGAYFRAGAYDDALEWCLRGLRLAQRSGGMAELAHAHNLLGVIYRDRGSPRRAVQHRTSALRLYEELSDLNGQADTLNNLGLDNFNLGQWQAATKRFEECLEIAERIGDLDLQAIVHNNLGEVFLAQGDLPRAKSEFRWTIDARQRLGHVAIGALAEANLGDTLAREGRTEEARKCLQSSLRDFRQIDARAFETDVNARLAALQLAEGRAEQAQKAAQDALTSASELHLGPVQAAAHITLGNASARLGDAETAEDNLQAALHLSRKAGDRYGEARALVALGSLYAGNEAGRPNGRTGRAMRFLVRGSLILEQLGASWDLAAARAQTVGSRS